MTRSGLAHISLSLAALPLLALGGMAQVQESAPPTPPGHVMVFRTGGPVGDDIGFVGFEAGIAGKTVTSAPFTATVSTQVTHLLADGNRIQRITTGTFARDSQGRTRREMTLPPMAMLGPGGEASANAVFINDPVADTSYIVHPDSKTAEQMPPRKWMHKAERGSWEAGAKLESERFHNEEVTTDLGTQIINGMSAQGTRITRTIPAGQIGNERPIVMVTERWYSPELQTYVLTKRSDPLMGDTVFQLTNIERAEPDPSLFQVPADYTVSQGRTHLAPRMLDRPPKPLD